MFTPHLNKLDTIKKNLKNASYDEAGKNIKQHLKAELTGAAMLINLKNPIVEYERILRKVYADLEELQDSKNSNKILMRNKCVGEIELAKQHLHDLHHQLEQISRVYFRK